MTKLKEITSQTINDDIFSLIILFLVHFTERKTYLAMPWHKTFGTKITKIENNTKSGSLVIELTQYSV